VNRIHSTARNQLPTIVSTIGDDKKTPLPKIQQARWKQCALRKQESRGAILCRSSGKR
jgi:hypothetical protein